MTGTILSMCVHSWFPGQGWELAWGHLDNHVAVMDGPGILSQPGKLPFPGAKNRWEDGKGRREEVGR